MLNYAIKNALALHIEREKHDTALLESLNREAENLSNAMCDGVIALGTMLEALAIFAEDKQQSVSERAISNDTALQLGSLLKAHGYLMGVLRETEINSQYHLANQAKGESNAKAN